MAKVPGYSRWVPNNTYHFRLEQGGGAFQDGLTAEISDDGNGGVWNTVAGTVRASESGNALRFESVLQSVREDDGSGEDHGGTGNLTITIKNNAGATIATANVPGRYTAQ